MRGITKNDIIYPIDRERILSMKHIASIFIALSLCTLPCFAEISTILRAEINPIVANPNEQLNNEVTAPVEQEQEQEQEQEKEKEQEKSGTEKTTKKRHPVKSEDLLGLFCTSPNDTKTKSGTVKCKKNAITITCNEEKTGNPTTLSNDEFDFKNICPNGDDKKSYSIEVVLAKKAQKKANEASQKTQCEDGDLGTWNDTLNKCNCNSGYVLDEAHGTCVKETDATTTAKKDLEALKNYLTDALKKIAETNNG